MATLSDTLGAFLDHVDELDATALANEVRRIAIDAARCIADHSAGEIAAIVQRAGVALIWLNAEARDPENRQNRRGRTRAVLDLLDLAESVRTFHAGRGDDDHLAAMRGEISAALRPIVDAADA
jgi:hypothetical protein